MTVFIFQNVATIFISSTKIYSKYLTGLHHCLHSFLRLPAKSRLVFYQQFLLVFLQPTYGSHFELNLFLLFSPTLSFSMLHMISDLSYSISFPSVCFLFSNLIFNCISSPYILFFTSESLLFII